MAVDKEILKNGSGYVDPTAYAAISNALSNEITFADELRYMMKINRLSKADVAEKIGWSEERIELYLRGERVPSFDTAQKIFSLLGYTTEVYREDAINYIESDMDDEERFHKLLNVLFDICKLSGFHIEERMVIKDMRTGRIWR